MERVVTAVCRMRGTRTSRPREAMLSILRSADMSFESPTVLTLVGRSGASGDSPRFASPPSLRALPCTAPWSVLARRTGRLASMAAFVESRPPRRPLGSW